MYAKSNCHRCSQLIYEKDKFGPVNGHVYHKSCFKCLVCETSLTLNSYKTSQASITDKEVYCASHAPKGKGSAAASKWTQPAVLNSPKLRRASSKENLLNSPSSSLASNAEKISIDVKHPDFSRKVSLGNVLADTVVDKTTSSSTISSTNNTESGVSKVLTENKKWSSRENLLAINTQSSRSDGRVANLTKKWSSKENLLDSSLSTASSGSSSQQIKSDFSNSNLLNIGTNKGSRENLLDMSSTATSYQIKRNSSNSNLLNADVNKGSRENLLDLSPSSASTISSFQTKRNTSNPNLLNANYNAGSRENLVETSSVSSYSSQKVYYSPDNRGSRENLIALDKPYNVTMNKTERRSSDYKRYDARKNSGEILNPKIEISYSPATQRRNRGENTTVIGESSSVQIGVKPKLIVDDLGNGINYSKYMDEIKRRQYNYSDPKKNVTDVYLKSPTASRKSGSTGDIFDKTVINTSEKTKIDKKKASVENLISAELNFYETFSNATTGYLNTDAGRLNIIPNKAATVGRCTSKQYDHEILEKVFTDSDVKPKSEDHHFPSEDTTKISINFKPGDNCCSQLSVQDGNVAIRTLPRDEISDSKSIGTMSYSSNATKSSRENMTQQKFAAEMHAGTQYTKAKADTLKHLGRLKITHQYVNENLCVIIERAENLYKDNSDTLDPYVTISLLPDPYKETSLTTLIAENNTNPEWKQKFIYGITLSHAKTKYIYLSVKDDKMASELLSCGLKYEALKLISLGEILIPLNNLQENVLYDHWYSLQEPSVVQDIILTKDL